MNTWNDAPELAGFGKFLKKTLKKSLNPLTPIKKMARDIKVVGKIAGGTLGVVAGALHKPAKLTDPMQTAADQAAITQAGNGVSPPWPTPPATMWGASNESQGGPRSPMEYPGVPGSPQSDQAAADAAAPAIPKLALIAGAAVLLFLIVPRGTSRGRGRR